MAMDVSHPLLGQNRWILGKRETWSQKKRGGERLTEEDTQCQPLAPKVHVPVSVRAHTHTKEMPNAITVIPNYLTQTSAFEAAQTWNGMPELWSQNKARPAQMIGKSFFSLPTKMRGS